MRRLFRIPLWNSSILFLVPLLFLVSTFLPLEEVFRPLSGGCIKLGRNDLTCFEDKQGDKSALEVYRNYSSSFSALPGGGDNPNFGFSQSTYWLKFEIHSDSVPFGSNILQVNNPILNEIELYQLMPTGPTLMAQTGDCKNFNTRPIDHRTFRFPISTERGKTNMYLLKMNSGGEQFMTPISLWSKEALAENDYQDNLMRGCYFGLIIFVLLFTLFLYITLKEKSSLYYVHYNLNLLLLQFTLSGYSFQFLWPNNPYLANVATPFFASLSILALLRFSQYFLQLSEYFPKINRAFTLVGYLVMINAGLSLIWIPQTFYISVITINIVALLLNIAIIPVAVAVLRKNFKPAKFFLIGFITLVITVFGFILTNLGFIRNDFYLEYGLLMGSGVEVVLLSFAVVDRFRSFKEQAFETVIELNRLQREQNETLEKTVLERTAEIQHQKTALETQQEEIISSIRYAERIQKNLLPTDQDMKTVFPESFVFYRPKDIVSGDFYWIGQTKIDEVNGASQRISILAAGDSTGHGVPGAMVSVLGCNLLRETFQQFPKASPNEMLNQIDSRLKKTMATQDSLYTSDGMDMVVCSINHSKMELQISGANNDVLVWNGEDFITLKGVSRGIGTRHESIRYPFETRVHKLEKGNIIYAFTDGFADQFGGANNKKLKISGLKSFLSSISKFNMSEQGEKTNSFFKNWKGDYEQIDDVCLIAVRV